MRRCIYIMISVLVMAVCGCHRSPYYHLGDKEGSLKIVFDWSDYTDIPPGMNLMFYPVITDDEDERQPTMIQLQYDGGVVSLPVGEYNVAIYNDYTYDIQYRGMEDFLTAEAYLDENNRQPLATRFADTRNVVEPDVYYVTQLRNLVVTSSDKDRIVTVRPELKTLTMRLHVSGMGFEYTKMADGGISGVASSVMLATGESADNTPSNLLFSMNILSNGLYAEKRVLLLADKLNTNYTLELAFLLLNNTVKMGKFVYDITEQVVTPLKANAGRIPPEGIDIYVDGIEIEEVTGGDGFDAIIDGWGNEVNIDLE